MKNILATAAAAFLLVTSTGCSGFLDEELKSSLAPDNTYTSSYGFEVGVNGLYGWAVLSLTHGERLPQARDKLARTNRSRLQPTLSMPVMATVHWFL